MRPRAQEPVEVAWRTLEAAYTGRRWRCEVVDDVGRLALVYGETREKAEERGRAVTRALGARVNTAPILEALTELRARMEGFKHYGDDWTAEEQEAAEAALGEITRP